MSYFSMFPVLSYDAKGNGKETIMTNLSEESRLSLMQMTIS